MPPLTDLNSRFAIPGALRFESGQGNLTRAVITTPEAEAHVYLHGAHVTHYQPMGQAPVLFMSGESLFTPDKPIRGGIPIIFPWFGPRAGDPNAPAHGFARTLEWSVLETKPIGSAVGLTLALQSSEATRRWFPHDFELRYVITLGAALNLSFEVHNRLASDFTFEEALHTYLSVSDVRAARVDGLDGRTFIDKTASGARAQQSGPIRIERETDRVYLDTLDEVTIDDPTASNSKEPGHASDIEIKVLASMMLDPQTAREVAAVLTRTRFRDLRNAILFDILSNLSRQNRHIDAVLIRQELDRNNELDAVGGVSYLARVLDSVPSAEHGLEDARKLRDASAGRQIIVRKTGSRTTVVWNPWTAKAKAMADFGDDEWPAMLCIETANAADNAVTLAAGQSHVMSATISAGSG